MFIDLYTLSAAISKELPRISFNYRSLFTSGALLYFLQIKGFDSGLIAAVQELNKQSITQPEYAYYRLARLLSDNNEFVYMNRSFSTPDEFIVYLYDNRANIEQMAVELLENEDFLAWLHHLGYGKHIVRWKEMSFQ